MNCNQRDSWGYSHAGLGGHGEGFGLVLNVGDATEGLLQKSDTIQFAF